VSIPQPTVGWHMLMRAPASEDANKNFVSRAHAFLYHCANAFLFRPLRSLVFFNEPPRSKPRGKIKF